MRYYVSTYRIFTIVQQFIEDGESESKLVFKKTFFRRKTSKHESLREHGFYYINNDPSLTLEPISHEQILD